MHLKGYLCEFAFAENGRFTLKHMKGDIIGGLTAAIVALPLAPDIGLPACNGDPRGAAAGLYGAIFTGTLASFFGGSSQRITGPTGGMTVMLTAVSVQYGGPDALLASVVAGNATSYGAEGVTTVEQSRRERGSRKSPNGAEDQC